MGAGLAMQICIQWPVVYRRYLEFCYGNDGNKLGTYQEVLVEPKLYVVNLFGQNGYSRGERQTIMLHWRLRCSRFLETALKSIRT